MNRISLGRIRPPFGRIPRRAIEDYGKLPLGAVTLSAIIVALLAASFVSKAGVGQTRYEADFAQAASLRAGDPVTVAGVGVGTVADLRLAGDHIAVTLRIDGGVHLGSRTHAAIKLTTLLGSRYVELRPDGPGALSGNHIPLDQTEVPYNLQDALADATTTFDQVDAQRIAQSLETLSKQLDGAPAVVPQAMRNIENLSKIVADRRAQLGSLLTDTGELTTMITAQQGNLGALVVSGRDLMTEISSRRDTIIRLLSATTTLIGQLHDIVNNDRPQIDQLITNLNALLKTLTDHDDLLRNTLQILPVPVRNFTNASGSGDDIDFTGPGGVLIDSWMCAISGRAQQLNLPPYLQGCK